MGFVIAGGESMKTRKLNRIGLEFDVEQRTDGWYFRVCVRTLS